TKLKLKVKAIAKTKVTDKNFFIKFSLYLILYYQYKSKQSKCQYLFFQNYGRNGRHLIEHMTFWLVIFSY
ncbi:MAG: hypothetical protein K2O31_05730, partial [Clostridia bacterium]|nr:hypothetical protein [Clostridia bacterium]